MDKKDQKRWLKIARAKLGISQEELGEMIGLSRSSIAMYESGTPIPEEAIKQIEIASGILRPSDPRSTSARLVGEGRRLKIYGAVSAGDGNVSSIDADEYYVPNEFARDDYGGLVIDGDSMAPFLYPSDIAIFRDWTAPKNKSVTVAKTGDGEWVCKQMMFRENGIPYLHSLNPRYEDIDPPFQLFGFLVGIIRDNGPERIIKMNPFGLYP